MSVLDVVFGEDIVLDEAAFNTAISDFAALGTQLQQLRTDIEDMLKDLAAGFNTPAGTKFIQSCKKIYFNRWMRKKSCWIIFQNLFRSQSSCTNLFFRNMKPCRQQLIKLIRKSHI